VLPSRQVVKLQSVEVNLHLGAKTIVGVHMS